MSSLELPLHGDPEESGPCEFLPLKRVSALLSGVVSVVRANRTIEDIRSESLRLICDLMHAHSAFWAWGRAGSNVVSIQPVAMLTVGYNDDQKIALVNMGLDPDVERTFRQPIAMMMAGRRQVAICRQQLFSDEAWLASRMYQHQRQIGFDSWVQVVRYQSADTWSNVFVSRLPGEPEFDATDAGLLHVSLESLPWLQPTVEPSSSGSNPSPFTELTDRQRIVLLLLLDGRSRKMIAAQLGISENTVGDHLRAIYRQFGVGSVGELTARIMVKLTMSRSLPDREVTFPIFDREDSR